MKVQPVSFGQNNNYKFNLVKVTGYGSLSLAAVSVIQASRHKMKSHKLFAWLSVASALSHVGILQYYHHKK